MGVLLRSVSSWCTVLGILHITRCHGVVSVVCRGWRQCPGHPSAIYIEGGHPVKQYFSNCGCIQIKGLVAGMELNLEIGARHYATSLATGRSRSAGTAST